MYTKKSRIQSMSRLVFCCSNHNNNGVTTLSSRNDTARAPKQRQKALKKNIENVRTMYFVLPPLPLLINNALGLPVSGSENPYPGMGCPDF
jgi:hypothetical protein